MSCQKVHGRKKNGEQFAPSPQHLHPFLVLIVFGPRLFYSGDWPLLAASLAARRSIMRSIVDVSSMIIRTWSQNMMAQKRVKTTHRSIMITVRMVRPISNV